MPSKTNRPPDAQGKGIEQSIPDPLDDLFHFCALKAFMEEAAETGKWPVSEVVKRRAYRLYENELAKKKSRR